MVAGAGPAAGGFVQAGVYAHRAASAAGRVRIAQGKRIQGAGGKLAGRIAGAVTRQTREGRSGLRGHRGIEHSPPRVLGAAFRDDDRRVGGGERRVGGDGRGRSDGENGGHRRAWDERHGGAMRTEALRRSIMATFGCDAIINGTARPVPGPEGLEPSGESSARREVPHVYDRIAVARRNRPDTKPG